MSDEHGLVARHEEERRRRLVAAITPLSTDPIPAADRFVAIDHNSPAFVQADEALDSWRTQSEAATICSPMRMSVSRLPARWRDSGRLFVRKPFGSLRWCLPSKTTA